MTIYTVTQIAIDKVLYEGTDKGKAEKVAKACMRAGFSAKLVGRELLEHAILSINKKTIETARKGLTL